MPKKNILYPIISAACLLFILTNRACSENDDNLVQLAGIEGAYLTIYYAQELDPKELAQKLDITYAEEILAARAVSSGAFTGNRELADMLDTLFLQVCDVLDMHLYSLKTNIKICKNLEQLKDVYSYLFYKDINTCSFYVYNLNTIYISPESFNIGVLSHEIAHAITSHYFVVQPPIKISEVLAGYVEYQLRKNK